MAHPGTTLPALAVHACRARATALAAIHGSGRVAGLDVPSGIAALAALIRRRTGMEVGMALWLIAVVGLIVLVWVVFVLVVVAVVQGG